MNEFKSTITVTGVQSFNDTIDGNAINFTKIFALTKLSRGNGYQTATHKWGDATNHTKIQDFTFPFQCEASFMMEVNKGNAVLTLVDLDLSTVKKNTAAK